MNLTRCPNCGAWHDPAHKGKTGRARGGMLAIGDKLNRAMVRIAGTLVKLDPPRRSREGDLLVRMAKAIEQYEQARYPILSKRKTK